jgi:hypothetical protein
MMQVACGLSVVAGLVWGGAAAAAVVPISQWGSMTAVTSGGSDVRLDYEFVVPASESLVISCQFIPSSYAPGAYEAGYVSPGWFEIRQSGGSEARVLFDQNKPYSQPFSLNYTMVLMGEVYYETRQGPYHAGALYTGTFVWNRDTQNIDVNVSWPGGQYDTVIPSSGHAVTGVRFYGPNDIMVDQHQTSWFGNVTVSTVAVPEPTVWGAVGAGILGMAVRRRGRGS